jgi:hypothetical protein
VMRAGTTPGGCIVPKRRASYRPFKTAQPMEVKADQQQLW